MTNREWLNSLSNEELAKLNNDNCKMCTPRECFIGRSCVEGIAEWLNEKHIEPMPEIKKGDIFVYLRNQIPFFGVCVYGNIVYIPDKGECFYFGGEIKENIVTIKRYDSTKGTMEEIWGADDE